MARHKKLEAAEDENPSIDISSLIDCCFLLLTYFLVCTTLVKELKLDMGMPSDRQRPPTDEVPADPSNIKIDPAGVVYWGAPGSEQALETDPSQRDLPSLYEQLENVRQMAEGTGQEPVVLLRVMSEVKQQRVIDVINTITRAKITNVALANVPEAEE